MALNVHNSTLSHRLCLRVKNADTLLIAFICIFAMFFYLECGIGEKSLFFRITGALADTSILVAPFIFLRRRWTLLLYAVMPFLGLLLLGNLIYFRNFNDFIPPSSYFSSSVSDPVIIDGVKNSLCFSDLLFLISLIPLILYVFFCRRDNNARFDTRYKKVFVLIAFVSISLTICGTIRREYIYSQDKNLKEVIKSVFPKCSTAWKRYYLNCNFTGYMVAVVSHGVTSVHSLDRQEYSEIRSSLLNHSKAYPFQSDSCHAALDNLIIIVVESLQSNVLSDEGAVSVIPTLDSLRNDSSIYFIEKCRVMVGPGRSSDAQFIINTGLLPLRNEPLVNNYANKDYPSLAKAFGYSPIEIIGEDRSLWSHGITSLSYGFSRLVDRVANNVLDQDSLIFNRAFMEYKKQGSPHFMFISTLSMHDPYTESNVTDKSEIATSGSEKQEYLRRLSHFDRSLGKFLKALRTRADYNNTLIVIAGDHEIRQSREKMFPADEYVPLFILNSPERNLRNTNVSQLDIFPTIVDLMQLRYKFMGIEYGGLGVSLTRNHGLSDSEIESAYRISELIITRKY